MLNTRLGKLIRCPLGNIFYAGLLLLSPLWAVAATHEVMVLDPSRFSPSVLTIEVGDTVRWINAAGGNFHDVTADDFSFNSPTARDFIFEMTFNSVAQILYHCTVHSSPANQGGTRQNGTINVVAATAAADISVDSVDVRDVSREVGEDVKVDVVLSNAGDGDSGAFSVSILISTDANVTLGDTLLGTIDVTNLAAGANMSVDRSLILPGNLTAGDYFIGAISNLADANPGNDISVDLTPVFVFIQFLINAGLNDAWFNTLTDGQGFFITIFPQLGFVSLAWFTYDTVFPTGDGVAQLGDRGHRWITALGEINGDGSVMEVTITSEGLFDSPTPVTRVTDGTITIKFNHCNKGTASYDIPSIMAQGEVPIVRVVTDNVALCEALLRELTLQAQ